MQKNNNTNTHIVTLHPGDWMKYKTLRLQALQNDPQAFGRSYEEEVLYSDEKWQERLTDALDGKVHAYFAEADSVLVGMIGAKILSEEGKKIAVVMQMYVDSQHRGKGIAKLLLTHLLKVLLKRGDIASVQLDVNTKQQHAIKLYQGMGFTIIQERKMVMGDGKMHDEFLMELNTHSITLQ